jgi:hypothetical protein
MKTDPTIVQFLSLPENLRLALQIAEAMEDVFIDLHTKFANAVITGLKTSLSDNSYFPNFRFESDTAIKKNNRYYGIWGILAGAPKENPLCYSLTYAEERDEHYLYYGLEWDNSSDAEPPGFSEKPGPLREYLMRNNYEINKWTYGFKEIKEYNSRHEFVIDLAERLAGLSKDCLDQFNPFFEETAELVIRTNNSLKGVK